MENKKFRYLCVGAANTAFGYCLGLLVYKFLSSVFHILFISTLISIINITVSFLTYKLFVFKSKGGWIKEYLKSYLIYGVATLISVISIWFLVNGLNVPFWIAQGIVILLTAALSYFGHSKYTFANNKSL
jgi:putative flippase GtrA